jgi:hypothetical protein
MQRRNEREGARERQRLMASLRSLRFGVLQLDLQNAKARNACWQ